MSNQKRVLPLDEICIQDKAVDYKLFSMLQNLSDINLVTKTRYAPKEHPEYGTLTRQRLLDLYNERCEDTKEQMSLKTLSNRLTLFKSIGMITEEFTLNRQQQRIPAYILEENYETFQYIPLETLKYLADTASSSVIKIYAYLLNKHIFKQKSGEYYSFTLGELAKQIGLKDNNNGNTRIVKNCLNSLLSVNLIKFADYYELTEDGNPSPRMRLLEANQQYKKLIK